MSPAGFEPAIPACERPQTHALNRAATGTGTTPDAAQHGPGPPHFLRVLDHTQRRITVGRTPLDE